ncbi:xylulokinase [Mucilaginibacter boryungensis]|uniref:FGGY-family carbohydrate kinase n=1 Tax=Mucilaginibacter boryungensis TaxID=768480 RepID=A0ABR9XKH2_9SPHI|nr:FGGY-family carbohydrate kinase [Mucilaginibacter boryungensis]MBE9667892.1 FGGY-family carbohydrate kinase [Mucilaginibacter boryungensis]
MNLVINLGLKSIRGIVFDNSGDQVYAKSYPVHTYLFLERVEQDATEWLLLLDKILSDMAQNTDLSHKILRVTVATSSSCILGVDEAFYPITKVLMVSDKRALPQVDIIQQYLSVKNIKKDMICPVSSLIPKAMWFKDNYPEIFVRVAYWLGAAELLNYYFTKQIFTDTLNASKALSIDGVYQKEVVHAMGIRIDTLPTILNIGSILPVDGDIITKYKFNKDCQFVLTTYDAICAVIGSGNGEPTNACDVSGTVTSVRLIRDTPLNSSNKVLLAQSFDFLNKYIIGSSNNLGGGLIEWCKQAFFENDGNDVYFQMENQAQLSSIGSGGIVFLPYLLGERSPFIAPNASATFFGINRSTTIKDFTRAVFESTAYVTRDLIELIENDVVPVETISVSGGLARFDTINQIKADVCNKPVHVVDNFESTSIGAFILMGIASGIYSSLQDAIKQVVKIRKTIYPSEKRNKIYNQYFDLYRQLNTQLLPLYDRHKVILRSKIVHENEIVRNL